jgi:hypothetical protein
VKRFALAVLIGVSLTAAAAACVYLTGPNQVLRIVLWPWLLLANAVPHGRPDDPNFEGSPLDFWAMIFGCLFSAVFYTVLAYGFMKWHKRVPRAR